MPTGVYHLELHGSTLIEPRYCENRVMSYTIEWKLIKHFKLSTQRSSTMIRNGWLLIRLSQSPEKYNCSTFFVDIEIWQERSGCWLNKLIFRLSLCIYFIIWIEHNPSWSCVLRTMNSTIHGMVACTKPSNTHRGLGQANGMDAPTVAQSVHHKTENKFMGWYFWLSFLHTFYDRFAMCCTKWSEYRI